MSAPRKGKGRQLAAVGAVVSLAGLAVYLYTSLAGAGNRDSGSRDLGGLKSGETSSSGKKVSL